MVAGRETRDLARRDDMIVDCRIGVCLDDVEEGGGFVLASYAMMSFSQSWHGNHIDRHHMTKSRGDNYHI